MQLMDAIALINASRKPILFLGAGFANQAANSLGESTPSSWQLVNRMLKLIDVDGGNDAPLSFAIDQMREKKKPEQVFDFLSEQLTVPDATIEQRRIMALPWRRIYTTNIDNIGVTFSNRPIRDAAIDSSPADVGTFVYLHGCLANTQPTNYYKRVKMGEQLYVAGSHSNSPYHALLQQDLFEADCIIVIGYSMGDPDLSTLFYGSSPDLANKCFVFSGNTGPRDTHRISFIGNDTKQTSTEFLALVDSLPIGAVQTYSPQITVEHSGHDTKTISQAARQNLLVFGRYDRNIARTSWSDPSQPGYVVGREVADAISALSSPATVLLHSHLGNGKTLAIEYAKYVATSQSRPTFSVDSSVELDLLRELFNELPTGSLVFFEGDVFLSRDTQQTIAEKNLVVCFTSRTTTMRVAAQSLYNNARTTIRVFDCNRLNASELGDFHDLIDSMAFWPRDLRDLSRDTRIERLSSTYDASTCSIVLSIFENEVVKNQITSIWSKSVPDLRPHLDHFLAASYMNMIDVECPPFLLKGFQPFDFKHGQLISNEIIGLSHSGVLSFSSSVIGEFVVQNLVDKEATIGAVVRFCNFMDGHHQQQRYQWIVRRLLRYWNLSRLLNSRTLPEEVFDRGSYIPSIASDPLFWVQYSIAKMENGDFLSARRFVDAAYGKAKLKGERFDTYQIDTHAARLTIRNLIDNGIYEGFALDLNRAVGALRSVADRRPDDMYHVSSVVTLLLASKVPFRYKMSDREYGQFRNHLVAIGDQIDKLTGGGEFSFAPERQAAELINRLR